MAVQPIPNEYARVTPYLIVKGASDAIDFYVDIFGAEERMRMPGPDGTIGHAEISIGDSIVMLADEFPTMGALSPKTVGGTPVMLHVYVEDVDDVFARAIAAGAKSLQAVEDKFYGDRNGTIEDPFGHHWSIASHVEDVSPDEMAQRAAKYTADQGGA